MKKIFLLSFLFLSCYSFAQNEKTLFWEISGNGLTKKSYLYGTMHVSEKVSYHLSDAFFKNLLASDMVGNESDPETWGDITNLLSENEIGSSFNAYSAFYKEPVKKELIKTIFDNNNNYFSNMLSSMEGKTADFQEDTVLDMFIYQTGRKYKKEIVGLEDAKESIIQLMKINEEDVKPVDENIQILTKIFKNRPFITVLNEYYREKDVVMLDSIYKLIFPKKAHDALIVNRNKIMANSIDELIKKGSLFSAVGAAHLAGKEGMIELLRGKGYTVTPIFDTLTSIGQKTKKDIETYFPNPGFVMTTIRDGMIEMPLTKNVINEFQNTGSPDFTNGGVINIKRIPLNYFLNKNNEAYNPKSLDSLFYENIPGEILEKKFFQTEHYSGYDIKNVSKTGKNQRYRFYITPLELIAVSMIGPGNYVRQFENDVFNSIKLKEFNTNWNQFNPEKGGFLVEIPSFNFVYGNSAEEINNIDIQAYDSTEKGYYFLTEKTLNNVSNLEDTSFEHNQIHYEFYLQHDAKIVESNHDKVSNSFTSSSKIGDKNINLKTIVNGNKYYLLGTVSVSDKNKKRFFDSFKIDQPKYKSKTEIFTDSIAEFKISIPYKENESLFVSNQNKNNNLLFKNHTFNSETGRTIFLEHNKKHRFANSIPIDTLKANVKKYFLNKEYAYDDENYYEDDDEMYYSFPSSLLNYSLYTKKGLSFSLWNKLIGKNETNYEIISEDFEFNENTNTYVFNAIVSKPNATQAVKHKVLFKENNYYRLKTLVNKDYNNDDAFIENTFNSIEITKKKDSLAEINKLKLFIDEVKSEKDTIRTTAINDVYQLNLVKEDFDMLKEFLTTFKFKQSENNVVEALIAKMGDIQDDRVIPFLTDYYKKEETQSNVQLSILKTISEQKNKAAYQKIMELMEFSLPISELEYEISSLFYYFEKDVENSKELFPKIFQFYSVKEYSKPIISFYNTLLEKNLIPAKKAESNLKMILTNAKLDYKRLLSWNKKNATDETTDDELDSYSDRSIVDDFIPYINFLSYFPKNKEAIDLLTNAKKLNIEELNIELIRLGIVNDIFSENDIKEALSKPETRFLTVNLLLNKNKKDLITFSDDEIALAAISNLQNLKAKDSLSFIEKRKLIQNEREVTYYFYKTKQEATDYITSGEILHTLAFVMENEKINPLAFKYYGSNVIDEDEELSDLIDRTILKSINEKHYRASFEKIKHTGINPFLFNGF